MLNVRITKDQLGELAERIHRNAAKIVSSTDEAVALKAQLDAPVDTGVLKNSVYASTFKGSGYADAKQKVREALGESEDGAVGNEALASEAGNQKRLTADEIMLPEVEQPGDDLTAIVAVGAEYGLYVEMGTVHQTAQPYLGPALESERAAFTQAMKGILR